MAHADTTRTPEAAVTSVFDLANRRRELLECLLWIFGFLVSRGLLGATPVVVQGAALVAAMTVVHIALNPQLRLTIAPSEWTTSAPRRFHRTWRTTGALQPHDLQLEKDILGVHVELRGVTYRITRKSAARLRHVLSAAQTASSHQSL